MKYLKPFNTTNPKILENLYNKNDEDMIEDLFYDYFYPTEAFPDSQAQLAKSYDESQPRSYELTLYLLNGKGPFIREIHYGLAALQPQEGESRDPYRSVEHKLPDGLDKFVEELELINRFHRIDQSFWLSEFSDIDNIFEKNNDVGKIFRYLDKFYNIKGQLNDILLKTAGLLHYGFVQKLPTSRTTEMGSKENMQIKLNLRINGILNFSNNTYSHHSIYCNAMVWNFYKPKYKPK